jgi:putative N6-adenine-specific DNA methylase
VERDEARRGGRAEARCTEARPLTQLRLVATCPEEIKEVLVQELTSLGAETIVPAYRAVNFTASDAAFYEMHLKLRTASRILRVIDEVPARTPEMLYSQARRIAWHEMFDVHHGFRVEPQGGDGMPPKQVITQVREAIRDVFQRNTGAAPPIDRDDPKVIVVAHMEEGRCTLSFDTCGKSLHKRGYRESGHPAPLKETLAAALLSFAGYDGTQPFLDPMCGSGTIAIEAAMIALHKAPQIHRKKGDFTFEWLKSFDRALWRETQERVRLEKLEATPQPVIAADIEPTYVALAQKSALSARVERYLRFETRRFQDSEAPAPTGILVTNLPYGERLAAADLRGLYEEIGDTLKQKFAGWRAALLAVEASPYKHIGLKTTRRIPISNGNIPCKLLIFDLYAGSRRATRST